MLFKKKKKLSHNQIRYVDGGSIKERKHAKSGSFIWPTAHPFKNIRRGNIKHVEGPVPYGLDKT